MAPKRILEDPPAAASSIEEEDSDGEEEVENDVVERKSGDEEEDEEDEDEDDEEENVNAPNPQSESASESDAMTHSPTASDFTVKPIVSKPTKKTTAKNAAPAKKKKKRSNDSGEDEDTKKAGRLWGEEDQVAILEGMIEFKAKKGTDPSSNMSAFHEFLRKNLKADASKNQLMDKVRRLKKKYHHPKGQDVFSKGHELRLFDLSRKIWGVEANGGEDGEKKPRKSAKAAADNSASPVLALPVPAENKVETEAEMNNVANGGLHAKAELDDLFWSKYPFLRDSLRFGKWNGLETVMMQGMPSIGSSRAKGLDDRWRKLQVLEMELVAKKLALEDEQTRLILDSMKS